MAEESEPDEFGQLEGLEKEYQEEMRRKVSFAKLDQSKPYKKFESDHCATQG